jgi:hypothetical protein
MPHPTTTDRLYLQATKHFTPCRPSHPTDTYSEEFNSTSDGKQISPKAETSIVIASSIKATIINKRQNCSNDAPGQKRHQELMSLKKMGIGKNLYGFSVSEVNQIIT